MGNQAFRVGHAVGTQDYVCLSTGWATPAFGPQATLFDADFDHVMTHFVSPNPDESGTPRPTWQDSRDTCTVWANPVPPPADGPNDGDRMSRTTYIQRINTTGGLRPTGACVEGAKALVPYTADYIFYRAVRGN